MTPTERIDSQDNTFDLADGTEGAEREDGSAGLPKKEDVPQETIESIEADREERLDPDNRPENTQVDNTERQFDGEAGMFTDDENYDGDLDERVAANERAAESRDDGDDSSTDSGADTDADSDGDRGTVTGTATESDVDKDEVPVSDLEGPSAQESMINPDAGNPTTPEN